MRNLHKIKSQFVFNKQQRIGVFILWCLIVALQLVYWFVDFSSDSIENFKNDELRTFQHHIDSVITLNKDKRQVIHPFNPNFISDYKGYVLGMSVDEIDRLHTFRKQNKYVNSVREFQQVTKISDSLLNTISVYFKFPEWVVKRQQNRRLRKHARPRTNNLNAVTVRDLVESVGLDYKIAYRVVNFRDKLGGFIQLDQLSDVYGLSVYQASLISNKFQLKTIPNIQKININLASASELASLVYINNSLSQNIIEERLLRGRFESLDELRFVEQFPEDKLERIKLYLTLN